MKQSYKKYLIHISLFIVTLITTTFAGAEWMFSKYVLWVDDIYRLSWDDFANSLHFSIPFLMILTFHEFGHYFTARYYRINVTLPYYIPLWLGFMLMPSLGTMGAFIRIKDTIGSLKHYFDVGIAGPLAGFVVAVGFIIYGYTHLPEREYIYQIHPEYEEYGADYEGKVYTYDFSVKLHYSEYLKKRAEDSLAIVNEGKEWGDYPVFEPLDSYTTMYFGKPVLFNLIENNLLNKENYAKVPGEHEIMHYPYLFAGLLALFFTALNLLPIGQLDGGHILFGLIGEKGHTLVSKLIFTALMFYAGLGMVTINSLDDIGMSSSLNFLGSIALYLYFLYLCSTSMFEQSRDRWLFATVIFVTQFGLNAAFGVEGYSGWLLFTLVLGRFIGIKHPPVYDNTKLNLARQILGWFALIVFVLSFSPEPLVVEFITP